MGTISILLPFKNEENYIEECLNSILLQSYTDWQLIAVDDHSDDQGRAILEEDKDPRIEVYTNERKGILPALQTAQKHIKGSYVTRMDADDIMPMYKLENLLKIVRSKTGGIVATGAVNYFSDEEISEGYQRYEKWLNKTADGERFYKRIYRECTVASANWMMRIADFNEMSGYNKLKYPEDYDMLFHWRKYGFQIKSCEQMTHLWREHPQRTSRNSDVYQQESFFRLKLSYFLEEFKEHPLYLIGTEKKGQLIALLLQEHQASFRWFTHEKQKTGSTKQGVTLEHISLLPKDGICILAVYPPKKERTALKNFIRERGYDMGSTAHFF